jgi:hypothetical protein
MVGGGKVSERPDRPMIIDLSQARTRRFPYVYSSANEDEGAEDEGAEDEGADEGRSNQCKSDFVIARKTTPAEART